MALEWNHSVAIKALKALAKEKKVEDYKTLITTPVPAEVKNSLSYKFMNWFDKWQSKAKEKAKERVKVKEKARGESKAKAEKEKEEKMRAEADKKEAEKKAEALKHPHQKEVQLLEDKIQTAMKAHDYDHAEDLIVQIQELDPTNSFADKMLNKIEKDKAEYEAHLHAEQKKAESKALEAKKQAELKAKAEKEKAEAKAREDKINHLASDLEKTLKAKHWDELQTKANDLLALEWNHSVAIKALKALAKEKKVEDYKTLITTPVPAEVKNSLSYKFMNWFDKWQSKAKEKAKERVKVKEKAKEEVKVKEKAGEKESKKKEEHFQKENHEEEGIVAVLSHHSADSSHSTSEATVKEEPKKEAKIEPEKKPISFLHVWTDSAKKQVQTLSKKLTPSPQKKSSVSTLKNEEKQDNVFTKMFGKTEDQPVMPIPEGKQASIIDTIVKKTDDDQAGFTEDKKPNSSIDGLALFRFSKLFLQFSILFIALTAVFFYVQNIDTNNTVLSVFGIEQNHAVQLHGAAEKLADLQNKEAELNKKINNFQSGYNNEYEKVIQNIIDSRIDWPSIVDRINEVTESVYERNAISQYVKYTSYSLDVENGVIRVSGSLSDPLGKNLTKLVELEEAFRYYPKDKNDPNDTTKPYFEDFKEFNSLSKSYDQKTGKYTSSFQLSFSLNRPGKDAE